MFCNCVVRDFDHMLKPRDLPCVETGEQSKHWFRSRERSDYCSFLLSSNWSIIAQHICYGRPLDQWGTFVDLLDVIVHDDNHASKYMQQCKSLA